MVMSLFSNKMRNEEQKKDERAYKTRKNGALQSKLLCWGVILPYHTKKKFWNLNLIQIYLLDIVSSSEKGKYDCLMICEKSVYFNYKSCKGKKCSYFILKTNVT